MTNKRKKEKKDINGSSRSVRKSKELSFRAKHRCIKEKINAKHVPQVSWKI